MNGKTRHPARPCAIEEIIAEMRGYSYGMPPSYHVTMSWADFRALLDRIEAAHRREVRETEDLFRKSLKKLEDTLRDQYEALVGFSNIANLREALRLCMGAMCKYCRADAKARGLPMECVNGCEVLLMTKDALAATEKEGGAK